MIYVCITTVPDRFTIIEPDGPPILTGLNSLLNQKTNHEFKLVISIPRNYENYPDYDGTLPSFLTDFISNHSNIILLRNDIDYGPITNLVYPLKFIDMLEDDLLIVADDDHVYYDTMIDTHVKGINKYHTNHATCFRGNDTYDLRTWIEDSQSVYSVTHNTDEFVGKKVGWFEYTSGAIFPLLKDTYVSYPDHYHTVCYKKEFLKDDLLTDEFLTVTYNNDYIMGKYFAKHDLHFMALTWDKETNYHPVNRWRGSHTYPIQEPIPFEDGGCVWHREKEPEMNQGDLNRKYPRRWNRPFLIEWDFVNKFI